MILDGDIAIVTGASRGLGAAIARALAGAGAAVAVTARRVEDAGAVADEIVSRNRPNSRRLPLSPLPPRNPACSSPRLITENPISSSD